MNSGEELQLPKLYVEIRASAAGRILHLVQEERSETVVSVTGVKVSARKSGELCELAGGEKILLVDTAPKVVPSDCDGVLLSNSDAHEWLQHKRLTSATESVGRAASERDSRKQWTQSFEMHPLGREGKSLRPPQYGGLCAIAAHWSLSNDVATIVMPTGTGKTEAMLAAFAGMVQGTTLIVVPSKNLKSQTVGKFLRLGLLRELGVVAADVPNPVVGVLDHRPKDAAEIEFIKRCDVVVAVINTVGQGSAAVLGDDIANLFETLMIDEAHHVAATTWAGLRDCYQSKKVLQFTATPFRRDGKPIEGKLLYTYPLGRAQADGYFKKIHFHGITEADPKDGDHAIARAAVAQLRADLSAGFDHLIMARCETIERAEEVQEIYRKVAADLKPILVHSELRDTESLIKALRNRASRIVVCVDMLGEGFDFPELKVAAVHDSHKSLAILLQFTGRFTRTGSSTIGEASVFANVATPQVRNALEALYTEDADWNKLLAELSSNAIKEQADLLGFLADTERLDSPLTDEPTYVLSPNALRVKFSTLVFEASDFHPKKFMDAVPSREMLAAAWLNTKARTLILVFRTQPRVTWTRAKAVHDVQWDLIVLHHDPTTKLVFVASTDHDASYVPLVQAVTGAPAKQVSGDNMFRVLGNISRLLLQIVGLKRHGTRRSISFSMFAGMNVREALSQQNRETSTKANVSGNGFESGAPTNAGCSHRVGARDGQEAAR
jgi:superfamily II DNA or RNA helicase